MFPCRLNSSYEVRILNLELSTINIDMDNNNSSSSSGNNSDELHVVAVGLAMLACKFHSSWCSFACKHRPSSGESRSAFRFGARRDSRTSMLDVLGVFGWRLARIGAPSSQAASRRPRKANERATMATLMAKLLFSARFRVQLASGHATGARDSRATQSGDDASRVASKQ